MIVGGGRGANNQSSFCTLISSPPVTRSALVATTFWNEYLSCVLWITRWPLCVSPYGLSPPELGPLYASINHAYAGFLLPWPGWGFSWEGGVGCMTHIRASPDPGKLRRG